MIREKIKAAVEQLVPGVEFAVEHPTEELHGDFACNVALVAKREGQSPRETALELAEELQKNEELMAMVSRVEVAGPGFINFWLEEDNLVEELERVVEHGGEYGRGEWGRGKRVLIDYSSPNIAKEFGVGHLRSTIIGQTLYNLYRFSGWEAVGDNHLGDWGTQFGMIIGAVEERGLKVEEMEVAELEQLYVEYNQRIKDQPELLDKAREAFARLERGDEGARGIWQAAVKVSMSEFERIYQFLGVKIDHAYGESFYEKMLPEVIEEAKRKGIARESEGAWIVEYPEMPPAILVKSDGATTYFTRDLATVKFRQENPELKSDRYIYEVGAEQTLHLRQVFATTEMLGWGKKEEFVHVAHGLILGEDKKKLSTRRGTGVKLEEWLMGMVDQAKEINPDSAKEVGIGAVKFFDLKHNPNTSYIFDHKEALSLAGNSGPYVQYACARAKRVMEKAGGVGGLSPKVDGLNSEELAILRWLYRFGETVEAAARQYAPNLLAEFLLELAKRFNTFYDQHQIIGGEKEAFRLSLTAAVAQVLENGLTLLGISVPAKM